MTEVLGLDGDYVDRSQLQIEPVEFHAVDLTAPPDLGRQFDLAMSLEVAEHLPPDAADGFVEYLTRLAPAVLFSAAIPGQGGTQHLNEQWPDYWARRFQSRSFLTLDCVRGALWQNDQVERWYAQNMLLFVSVEYLGLHPELQALAARTDMARLALVHPRTFAAARRQIGDLEQRLIPANMSLRMTLRLLPGIFAAAVKRRVIRSTAAPRGRDVGDRSTRGAG